MAIQKNQLPDKYLMLRHLENGIVQLSVDSDICEYSLLTVTIPDHLMKETNPNPNSDPITSINAFNLTENKWECITISELTEYRGRVRRYAE